MEAVLRKVKEEIVISQREREELEFKLDEAEKRREAAEMMAQDAESKMAGTRAGKASAEAAAAAAAASGENRSPAVPSNKEVEIAVERVARELHALYKSKHETKVAALKKSYEHRWEKQVRKLQAQVDQLTQENEDLRHNNRLVRGIDPARLHEMEEERRAERARDAAQIRELEAEVEKVEAVLKTVQADNDELRVLLERERVEKGELVMLAEEMMNMQQSFVGGGSGGNEGPEEEVQEEVEERRPSAAQQEQRRSVPAPAPAPVQQIQSTAKTPNRRQSSSLASSARTPGTSVNGGTTGGEARAAGNNFRMSMTSNNNNTNFRASGLRAPGTTMGFGGKAGESRIGRGGGPGVAHERTKSAAVMGSHYGQQSHGGLPRPGSGSGLRRGGGGGGIMRSIERMGGGGGGGYHSGSGGGFGLRRGE